MKPIEILLVEDSPTDAILAKEALASSKIINVIHLVSDGEEALAYLRKEGKYCNVERPDIVLLDLNLPKIDGKEVLAEIKTDENLKRIPVVVLTTSHEEKDIFESYGHHANCYVIKPVNFGKFAQVVADIEGFWFTVVKLPS